MVLLRIIKTEAVCARNFENEFGILWNILSGKVERVEKND